MTELRLLTWNVHGFRAGPDVVAEAVAGQQPDVTFINEAGRRRALNRFARRLGGQATSGLTWRNPVPNAVVVRPPWRVVESRIVRFARSGRLIPRGAVLAHLGTAGVRMWAVSVHLGLSDREREAHARELGDLVAGLTGPVVLGGDLNEGPDGAAATWLSERLWDAFGGQGEGLGHTFPSAEPRARIDYLLLGEGLRPHRVWVEDRPEARAASDHLPLFADVTVPEP